MKKLLILCKFINKWTNNQISAKSIVKHPDFDKKISEIEVELKTVS